MCMYHSVCHVYWYVAYSYVHVPLRLVIFTVETLAIHNPKCTVIIIVDSMTFTVPQIHVYSYALTMCTFSVGPLPQNFKFFFDRNNIQSYDSTCLRVIIIHVHVTLPCLKLPCIELPCLITVCVVLSPRACPPASGRPLQSSPSSPSATLLWWTTSRRPQPWMLATGQHTEGGGGGGAL